MFLYESSAGSSSLFMRPCPFMLGAHVPNEIEACLANVGLSWAFLRRTFVFLAFSLILYIDDTQKVYLYHTQTF